MWNPQVPLSENPKEAPRIFQFLDYREFLREFLRYKKDVLPGFSLGVFSKRCGFGSKSFLQFVLANKRNISMASCDRLIRALKLTHEEAVYFATLVQENQETDDLKKARLTQELHRQRDLRSLDSKDSYDETLSSHWIIPSIRRLSQLSHFKRDPSWIQRQFSVPVTVEEIGIALKVIDQATPEAPYEMLGTEEQRTRYYRQIVHVANSALSRRGDLSDQIVSPLTITMDPEVFRNFKTEVLEFRQRMHKKYGSSRVSDTQVYQFTLLCLAVTQSSQE